MRQLLLTAVKAAVIAGKEILEIYDDPKADFQIERKADNSPLTIADRKANDVITQMLSKTSVPILSEEGKHIDYNQRKTWRRLWIVDPLDGTKEFIKRNGEFTVNIALAEEGNPVIGVVYVPVAGTLYFGCVGEGAWRIKQIINDIEDINADMLMRAAQSLPIGRENKEDFVVVASRSHLNAETEDYIRKIEKEKGNVKLISCGSSIKICRIAEGSADVYPRFAPTMEWDTAAGHAIVRATGKQVYKTDEKTPIIYNKEDLHNPYFIVK